jgi:hypothetical protein
MKLAYGKVVDSLNIAIFKRAAVNKPTYIKKIGYTKEHFGAIPGDWAFRIDVGDESIYTIMYFAPKDGVFPKGWHLVDEIFEVCKGKVKIETPNYTKTIGVTETCTFAPSEWHEVTFLEDTILFIHFHPCFENGDWEGFDGKENSKVV